MDIYGVHRVVGVFIDMMPIPIRVVPVLVNQFLTVYILRGF